jgi:hypothetical protein
MHMHPSGSFFLAGLVLALGSASAFGQQVQAQPGVKTDIQFHGGFTQTPWFADPTVRKQLNLTDEQFNALNQAYMQRWQNYSKSINELGKLDETQRFNRVTALGQTLNQGVLKSADEALKAEQRERFRQLSLQYWPYGSLTDAQVQQKLNLTDQQRADLLRYSQQYYDQLGTIYQGFGKDRDASLKRYNELQLQSNQQLGKILNDQQMQMWRQMTGDPFRFPPTVSIQGTIGAKQP